MNKQKRAGSDTKRKSKGDIMTDNIRYSILKQERRKDKEAEVSSKVTQDESNEFREEVVVLHENMLLLSMRV